MKSLFVPLDYDYFDYEGKNYLKITGRNEKGRRLCVIDNCDVYLWAILKDNLSKSKIDKLIEEIKKIEIKSAERETIIEKVEIHKKNFLEKPVDALKIFVSNYKDLQEVANCLKFEEIEKRRGYDLGLITHYIIEKKLNPLEWYEIEGEAVNGTDDFGGIDKILEVDLTIKFPKIKELKNREKELSPKILCYDIETDELKIGEGEIVMISLVSENFKKVITWKKEKTNQSFVEYVKDEKEMLKKFVEYTKKISPDFLIGYFSDGFDMPYIKARAAKLKVDLSLGLDGTRPIISRGISSTAKIKGLVHIDLLKFIRTAYGQYMQSETLSLNEVSKEFLNDTKKPFAYKHSSKVEDWEEYFEYSLHDSVLVYKLFEKFWPDIMEFSKLIKEPVYEVTRAGLSRIVDSYIVHNLERFNEIPEKKPSHDQLTERKSYGSVEGAFVLEPKPGLYERIAMFDFTSMHTSIIISMNISKSTLLEKKEKNSHSIETNLGTYHFTNKKGFLPTLLEEIFDSRKKAKADYKKNPNSTTKARNNAFKVLSASVHGYIAFFGARYYSKESSSSILAYVRKFNIDTIKEIEKRGHKVVYGDTDSVAFLMEDKKESQIKEMLEDLNSKLPGIMELELEDFYKRGLWVTTRSGEYGAKKKYALLTKEGKLKIRGFETVRRDWCKLARILQNEVIKMILEDGNEKRALEYVKKIVKKIKDREISTEDLIIKSQLRKPISEYKSISPHVIAAKKMIEKKIPISQGALVGYYVAQTNTKSKLIRDKVKLPEEKGEYDIDYYLKNQILPAVENILQIFKINIKEIVDGKKQTKLGDF